MDVGAKGTDDGGKWAGGWERLAQACRYLCAAESRGDTVRQAGREGGRREHSRACGRACSGASIP